MIDPIIERLIGLFSPAEWRAIAWLLLATVAATHTLKIVWRWSPFRGGSHGHVQLIAVVAGFASAFFVWPAAGTVPWFMAGVIAGPASSVAFWMAFALLKKYLPTTAAAINADRRRNESGPPPGDVERRKTDD